MPVYAALTGPVPKAAVIVLALLAAVAVLGTVPRLRAAAVVAALALAPTLLLADIWDSPQVRVLHRHPALDAVAGLAALAALAALAGLIVRRPWMTAPLAVVALPFRIPIQAGGSTSNLLVPLYGVIAAASLAGVWKAIRAAGASGAVPGGPPPQSGRAREFDLGEVQLRRDAAPGWIARLLAAYVVLYAIQATYSPGFEKALQQLVFFYVPFSLLFAALGRVGWTAQLARRCLLIAAGLAVLFAGIGFLEYSTKTIFLNPKLVAANDVHAYFTVNSVFFDPDIFGRFLALVMVGLSVGLLLAEPEGRPRFLALAAGLATLWGGLVLTLSRSSLGALLVGLATLAALRFRATRVIAPILVVIAIGAAVVAATPKTFGLNQGLNGASSGRASLVTGGIDLFAGRPVWGWGSGSFVTEYRRHNPRTATTLSASHTIPITIGAEQGLIGEALYLALVLCSSVTLLSRARESPARAGIAAAFLALVFHTMLYADFLEDPTTWFLLATGAALAAGVPRTVTQRSSVRATVGVPSTA